MSSALPVDHRLSRSPTPLDLPPEEFRLEEQATVAMLFRVRFVAFPMHDFATLYLRWPYPSPNLPPTMDEGKFNLHRPLDYSSLPHIPEHRAYISRSVRLPSWAAKAPEHRGLNDWLFDIRSHLTQWDIPLRSHGVRIPSWDPGEWHEGLETSDPKDVPGKRPRHWHYGTRIGVNWTGIIKLLMHRAVDLVAIYHELAAPTWPHDAASVGIIIQRDTCDHPDAAAMASDMRRHGQHVWEVEAVGEPTYVELPVDQPSGDVLREAARQEQLEGRFRKGPYRAIHHVHQPVPGETVASSREPVHFWPEDKAVCASSERLLLIFQDHGWDFGHLGLALKLNEVLGDAVFPRTPHSYSKNRPRWLHNWLDDELLDVFNAPKESVPVPNVHKGPSSKISHPRLPSLSSMSKILTHICPCLSVLFVSEPSPPVPLPPHPRPRAPQLYHTPESASSSSRVAVGPLPNATATRSAIPQRVSFGSRPSAPSRLPPAAPSNSSTVSSPSVTPLLSSRAALSTRPHRPHPHLLPPVPGSQPQPGAHPHTEAPWIRSSSVQRRNRAVPDVQLPCPTTQHLPTPQSRSRSPPASSYSNDVGSSQPRKRVASTSLNLDDHTKRLRATPSQLPPLDRLPQPRFGYHEENHPEAGLLFKSIMGSKPSKRSGKLSAEWWFLELDEQHQGTDKDHLVRLRKATATVLGARQLREGVVRLAFDTERRRDLARRAFCAQHCFGGARGRAHDVVDEIDGYFLYSTISPTADLTRTLQREQVTSAVLKLSRLACGNIDRPLLKPLRQLEKVYPFVRGRTKLWRWELVGGFDSLCRDPKSHPYYMPGARHVPNAEYSSSIVLRGEDAERFEPWTDAFGRSTIPPLVRTLPFPPDRAARMRPMRVVRFSCISVLAVTSQMWSERPPSLVDLIRLMLCKECTALAKAISNILPAQYAYLPDPDEAFELCMFPTSGPFDSHIRWLAKSIARAPFTVQHSDGSWMLEPDFTIHSEEAFGYSKETASWFVRWEPDRWEPKYYAPPALYGLPLPTMGELTRVTNPNLKK